ncbi:MAG: cytochrome c [Spirochaetia bacterium]|nr:cytochrome c [Spirochaetia bacterium]
MNYPVWVTEVGGNFYIALISIFHVYIAHFAIGGGIFLVLTEHYAYRKNDTRLLDYLKLHSKFFALVTLVAGALSGVGIWFVVSLVSPTGISALIRVYVWAWAIEWVLFFVEIIASIAYYSSWNTISRKRHLTIGWIYVVTGILSLAVINGIITFMLTPGEWIETKNITDGFFNPTYKPSLFLRFFICISLAGIYALFTTVTLKDKETRAKLLRYASIWAIVGALMTIPGFRWYFSLLPEGSEEMLLLGGMPIAQNAYDILTFAGVLLIIFLLVPLFIPRKFHWSLTILIAAFALSVFGAAEWIRETIRRPYVIYDYLYGNNLRIDEYENVQRKGGILKNALWVKEKDVLNINAGKDIFRIACRSCHTLNGYNALAPPFGKIEEEYIYAIIGKLKHLRGKMPPLAATEEEKLILAKYLYESGKKISQTEKTGHEVFEKRCTFCHTKDKYNGLYDSFEGEELESIRDSIPILDEMAEEMVPWFGNDDEADLLAKYIHSWYLEKKPSSKKMDKEKKIEEDENNDDDTTEEEESEETDDSEDEEE